MDFIVHTPDVVEHFRGDSSYKIQEGGVLVVRDTDTGKRMTYSPGYWRAVEEANPPAEGGFMGI